MLKALLKKQFLELNAFYFQDRKTGKRRSKGKITAYIILYSVIFLFVAFSFFGMSFLMAESLLTPGFMAGNSKDWLYFAIMSMLAILMGTFGSVFNTYTGLYLAKDNEMMLSLPVPAGKLLLARMAGVYTMSLLYSALVWVPAVVCSWIVKLPTVTGIIFPILLTFVLALLVTVLTCLFGWLVALAAGKLKGKNFLVVIISVLFFAGYYYVCFNLNSLLQSLAANSVRFGEAIKTKVFVLYELGLGATGDPGGFLGFTLITLVLFAICYFILSRSFRKILSTSHGTAKVEYKEKSMKNSYFTARTLDLPPLNPNPAA